MDDSEFSNGPAPMTNTILIFINCFDNANFDAVVKGLPKLAAKASELRKSNKVPVVQHPHHVHPLTPLITYSNEHFTPGNPPPHLPADVDPKTGIPRPPHPPDISPYYPLSPGTVGQIPHPLGWQGQPVYPITTGGFRHPYPTALTVNASMSRFPPHMVPPHHSLHTTGIPHPAIVTPTVKQESSQSDVGSLHSSKHQDSKKEEEKKKPHIKKPLNAFMLYMKEMRAKVVAECTLKESAAINQILGRRWHALSREEQAKYYELARKERQLHMQLYPGWSARDNYVGNRKIKLDFLMVWCENLFLSVPKTDSAKRFKNYLREVFIEAETKERNDFYSWLLNKAASQMVVVELWTIKCSQVLLKHVEKVKLTLRWSTGKKTLTLSGLMTDSKGMTRSDCRGDRDSGTGCSLSKFASKTKVCGAVNTLEGRWEGRNAIQRDLDRSCRSVCQHDEEEDFPQYDGFDCVYGLELHKDERVSALEVLPDRVASSRISDAHLADTMIGKAVEHMFETEDGSKDEWRGMVLARAPIMNTWFYITYEKDPVLYMYQLLDDYKEGDLRIMPDSNDSPPAEREPGEVVDSLVGKQVEYAKEDGSKRTGMVIHQVEAKPSVYFIKFDDDFHIYVYDLVKTS
ncbi:hypothetical protein BTVI_147199 [Pitangus sulphuratus]|nr:hypothetical protein BTVI_147199 [Pitangus sulphuratus]